MGILQLPASVQQLSKDDIKQAKREKATQKNNGTVEATQAAALVGKTVSALEHDVQHNKLGQKQSLETKTT